jgi:hypothetical protein
MREATNGSTGTANFFTPRHRKARTNAEAAASAEEDGEPPRGRENGRSNKAELQDAHSDGGGDSTALTANAHDDDGSDPTALAAAPTTSTDEELISPAEGTVVGAQENAEQDKGDDADTGGSLTVGKSRGRQPVKMRQEYQKHISRKFEEERKRLLCDRCKTRGNIGPNGTRMERLAYKCHGPGNCKRTFTEPKMIEMLDLVLRRRDNKLCVEPKSDQQARPATTSIVGPTKTRTVTRPATHRAPQHGHAAGGAGGGQQNSGDPGTERELALARQEIEKLKREATDVARDRAMQSKQAHQLEQKYEQLCWENEQIRNDNELLRQENDNIHQKYGQMRKEHGQMRQENGQMHQKYGQMRQENNQMCREIGQMRLEIDQMRQRLDSLAPRRTADEEEATPSLQLVTQSAEENGDEGGCEAWSDDEPLGETPGPESAWIPAGAQHETQPRDTAVATRVMPETATYAAAAARAAATTVEAPVTARMRAAARAIVRAPREETVLDAVYLTSVRKTRLGTLRMHLKEWGVNTRRVSNLSFIGGNILEATVARPYKTEFLETVTRMGWQHAADFDPLSESTLRRERTQTLTVERRKELATRLYVQRIARSLRTTRPGPLQRFLQQMMQRAPNYAVHLEAGTAGAPAEAHQEEAPPPLMVQEAILIPGLVPAPPPPMPMTAETAETAVTAGAAETSGAATITTAAGTAAEQEREGEAMLPQ